MRKSTRVSIMRWSLGASLLAASSPGFAAQPVIITPPGTPALPNLIYELPYATSNITAALTRAPIDAEMVVSLGLAENNGLACMVQVEWLDWNGATVGFSGPVNMAPGQTLEFTTLPKVFGIAPFILNVFSDITGPFEGHAHIRSDTCQTLAVDAELVMNAASKTPIYKPVMVIGVGGNRGQ